MATRLKYKTTFEPQLTTVKLSGPIDEHVGEVLEDLRPQVRTPHVTFDCEDVTIINSIGAATWMAHLRAFQEMDVKFIRCSTAFTSLCLIMPDLIGSGAVESLFVTYYCKPCDHQLSILAERSQLLTSGYPEHDCSTCKAPMIVDPENADFIDVITSSAAS